jgi:lysyl-tRNA synthetase class 2
VTPSTGRHDPVVYRSELIRHVRNWFVDNDYLEVSTPTILDPPALETHIDAVPAGRAWLRTSPELHMKRLMARGYRKIFQIGPCYRAEEHGRRHRLEFTMLEWYAAGETYEDLIVFTEGLFRHLANKLDCSPAVSAPFARRTVAEAFAEFASTDPDAALAADQFDLVLVDQVEPNLGIARPEILIDYPAALGALARLSPHDSSVAERWELYVDGLELANAYTELIDPLEQRRRFEQSAAERLAAGRQAYPIDEDFLAAMPDMPPMAGCALGVDRLHMVCAGLNDIAEALPFD